MKKSLHVPHSVFLSTGGPFRSTLSISTSLHCTRILLLKANNTIQYVNAKSGFYQSSCREVQIVLTVSFHWSTAAVQYLLVPAVQFAMLQSLH